MKRTGVILTALILSTLLHGCGSAPAKIRTGAAGEATPWTHLEVRNDPADFQFAIVSDRTGSRRSGIFAAAVGKLNILQPEFVMCVGDLIEGYTEDREALARQWDEFDSLVAELEMPFFYLPGNHDITNAVMIDVWNERFGRSWYHFVYHDVLFLCLNSEDPPRAAGADSLGIEQLEWVERVLRKNRKTRWVCVFVHKPMWERGSVGNWERLEALLEGRDYTVFAGHLHTYGKTVRNEMRHYRFATTGGSSNLAGVEAGRFDHVVWVTMTDEGPLLANLMLDGIFGDDPPHEASPGR